MSFGEKRIWFVEIEGAKGRLFLLQKKEEKWCEKFQQRVVYSFVMLFAETYVET